MTPDPNGNGRKPIPAGVELIALGVFTRTQGNQGAVRLFPYFTSHTRIEELAGAELYAVPTDREKIPQFVALVLHISEISYHKQFIILKFKEIGDMHAAEELHGLELCASDKDMWDLEYDEFFVHELVGWQLVHEDGRSAGEVVAVDEGASHDFLRVRPSSGREYLVPFVRAMIRDVDRETRTMVVKLPPGLEDI